MYVRHLYSCKKKNYLKNFLKKSDKEPIYIFKKEIYLKLNSKKSKSEHLYIH